MAYQKAGTPFLYDEASGDIVGIRDADGGEQLFGVSMGNKSGKRYALVGGVIRNAGSASSYWQPIADGFHGSPNVDSVATSSTDIRVNYPSINAVNVVSFVAVPDETLTQAGFTMGCSVDKNFALITMQRTSRVIEDYITWNGSAFVANASRFTIGTYSAGVLTLSHADMDGTGSSGAGLGCAITPRGYTYDAVISSASGAITSAATKVEFWNRSTGVLATAGATGMDFSIVRTQRSYLVDPRAIDTTAYPSSNIWMLGLFEI